MLRDALYIARMDAGYLLSRRETITWTFVMPVVFFYFIGTITGHASAGGFFPADVEFLNRETGAFLEKFLGAGVPAEGMPRHPLSGKLPCDSERSVFVARPRPRRPPP